MKIAQKIFFLFYVIHNLFKKFIIGHLPDRTYYFFYFFFLMSWTYGELNSTEHSSALAYSSSTNERGYGDSLKSILQF